MSLPAAPCVLVGDSNPDGGNESSVVVSTPSHTSESIVGTQTSILESSPEQHDSMKLGDSHRTQNRERKATPAPKGHGSSAADGPEKVLSQTDPDTNAQEEPPKIQRKLSDLSLIHI